MRVSELRWETDMASLKASYDHLPRCPLPYSVQFARRLPKPLVPLKQQPMTIKHKTILLLAQVRLVQLSYDPPSLLSLLPISIHQTLLLIPLRKKRVPSYACSRPCLRYLHRMPSSQINLLKRTTFLIVIQPCLNESSRLNLPALLVFHILMYPPPVNPLALPSRIFQPHSKCVRIRILKDTAPLHCLENAS